MANESKKPKLLLKKNRRSRTPRLDRNNPHEHLPPNFLGAFCDPPNPVFDPDTDDAWGIVGLRISRFSWEKLQRKYQGWWNDVFRKYQSQAANRAHQAAVDRKKRKDAVKGSLKVLRRPQPV